MYLTFDVGTTSVKTALYDKGGKLISKVINDYNLSSPKPGWCEAHPDIYWIAVLSGFREICSDPSVNPKEIKAICGCSQGETIILLDGEGKPVRPAIVWLDNRATADAEELRARFGEDEIFNVTGMPEMGHLWSAPKLLWLKKNEPASLQKARFVMLVEDYIGYMLTGEAAAVPSHWATTIIMDIRKGCYWDDMAEYLGIADKLPPIVEEASVLGSVHDDLTDLLGLSPACRVVKGSMDQNMSALGAGNISPGIITETTGTALVIAVATDKLPGRELRGPEGSGKRKEDRLPVQPHAVPGMYLFMPFSQTAGILYKWFRDNFGGEELLRAGDPDKAFTELNRLAESIPAGADGLILLPFFSGGVLPKTAPDAKGVFYGLTLSHGKGHFVRAILESIGFMLKDILGAVSDFGIPVSEIHAMGGGARSDLWLSIKADICGIPVIRMLEEETSTLGAAIVCAVSTGTYATYEEAVKNMVRTGERFLPRPENAVVYQTAHNNYNSLFNKLYR